jgi:MFS family permease
VTRRGIVRTYYLLAGLHTLSASLIWSVNTLFLLDAGLTIAEVFGANAAFSLGMVVFEIPTGVVADTLGRRISYLFSLAVLAGTTVLYLVMAMTGQGVVPFAIVSLFIGLGFTFYSGALEAWVVDELQATGGVDLDLILARGQQVAGGAMLVGTVGGGLLGQLDLALPFVVRTGLLLALFVLSLSWMQERAFTPRRLTRRDLPRELLTQARVSVRYGWRRPGLRPLMLTAGVRSGFLFWAFYAAQPYLLEVLERDAVWVVGVVTAGLSVATMVGNQAVHLLSRRYRHRTTVLAGGIILLAIGALVMGGTDRFPLVVVGFVVMGFATGVTEPAHRAYVHTVTASEHRATVLSFDSMIASSGGTVGQFGLGLLADARSLAFGYVVGGLGTLLALPLLGIVRRVGGPGDRFAGGAVEESLAPEPPPDPVSRP